MAKKKLDENKIKKIEEKMKSKLKQGREVKICPKCGSEEIGIEADSLNPIDYCKSCGFNSMKKGIVEIIHFPTKLKK